MIDIANFRKALGQFATGVTIMTCKSSAGQYGGMTVSSFASLSLSPPLILWSIDKKSDQFVPFKTAHYYAVNILSEEQQYLSDQFSAPKDNKFGDIPFETGKYGAPIFPESLAIFECLVRDRHDGGDHIIMVGEVKAMHHIKASPHSTARPLLHFDGKYAKITP